MLGAEPRSMARDMAAMAAHMVVPCAEGHIEVSAAPEGSGVCHEHAVDIRECHGPPAAWHRAPRCWERSHAQWREIWRRWRPIWLFPRAAAFQPSGAADASMCPSVRGMEGGLPASSSKRSALPASAAPLSPRQAGCGAAPHISIYL